MTIKQQGGIFGRNPTFNDLTVEGSVSFPANSVSGDAISGGTPELAGLAVNGQATITTDDNNAQLTLISTDTDANVGPLLNLWRNSGTGTNGDLIGEIKFTGEDTVGSTNVFATISGVADQTNNGSEDGSLRFKSLINGSLAERLVVSAAGNVEVSTGNLIIGTSGQGIDFSATSGTGTSELFDDYEEGTFTPVLSDESGNNATAGFSNGVYTKIGRTVVAEFYLLNINTSGLTSGDNIRISLPFTHISAQRGTAAVYFSKVTFSTLPVGVVNPGQAFLELFEASSGADGGYVPVSTLASGTADVFATVTFNT
jgi:hypothetical protein